MEGNGWEASRESVSRDYRTQPMSASRAHCDGATILFNEWTNALSQRSMWSKHYYKIDLGLVGFLLLDRHHSYILKCHHYMPIWFLIFCQYIPPTGTKLTALSFLIFKLCTSFLIQFTPTASHSSLTSTDIFRPSLKYISLEFSLITSYLILSIYLYSPFNIYKSGFFVYLYIPFHMTAVIHV